MRTHNAAGAGRPGFTLVELLVVIAVIAVLLSLTSVAYQKVVENERNRASDNMLHKVQPALEGEYDAVVKKCAADKQNGKIPPAVLTFCEGDPERALAVWTALQLRRHLPQTFAEATTYPPAPFNIPELAPLAVFKEVAGLSGTPETESAALLFIILTKSQVGGSSIAADEVTQKKQKDVSFGGQPLKVFTDGWDNPISFQRWARNNNIAAMGDQRAVYKDPLDPAGKVVAWKQGPNPHPNVAFLNTTVGLGFNAQYRLATVYSMGKDKQINPDFGGNNLAGYRIRELGKKGK